MRVHFDDIRERWICTTHYHSIISGIVYMGTEEYYSERSASEVECHAAESHTHCRFMVDPTAIDDIGYCPYCGEELVFERDYGTGIGPVSHLD